MSIQFITLLPSQPTLEIFENVMFSYALWERKNNLSTTGWQLQFISPLLSPCSLLNREMEWDQLKLCISFVISLFWLCSLDYFPMSLVYTARLKLHPTMSFVLCLAFKNMACLFEVRFLLRTSGGQCVICSWQESLWSYSGELREIFEWPKLRTLSLQRVPPSDTNQLKCFLLLWTKTYKDI